MTERHIHLNRGTPEAVWLASAPLQQAPAIGAAALVPPGSRAVAVAPHPDDEVLAAGGLMAELAALGRPVAVIAVTDGTASHPQSRDWPPERLARERPAEQVQALAQLGIAASALQRLGLPDGGLMDCEAQLTRELEARLTPDDIVITPWRLDGHPDHEAVGRACAQAALRCQARLIEVPVWAWHWAQPQDARLPWPRARRLPLSADALRRKQAALQAFHSQRQPDASTGAPAVLHDSIVARAARPFELFWV